jgi:hypothetical protein
MLAWRETAVTQNEGGHVIEVMIVLGGRVENREGLL